MSPVVETHDLTRRFGDRNAVHELNLCVSPGEVVGLLGPNGAGKTTTIRMLTTLLAPTSGRAFVGGIDVERHPSDVRRLIGYISQEKGVRNRLTGRESVDIEASLRHMPRRRRREVVEEVLDMVGLLPHADRLVSQYSGGMIKRLDLACGLLQRPEILILDEPTLALDVQSRRRVWDYVSWLRSEGVAILMATNYMDEADQLCDRVTIMDGGREIVTGAPSTLKRSAQEETLEPCTLDDVFLLHTRKPLVQEAQEELPQPRRAADLASLPEQSTSIGRRVGELSAFMRRWYLELTRERLNLVLTFLQPAIWLVFFGGALGRAVNTSALGSGSYVAFVLPGVLALIAVGVGISGAIPLLWDKETGYLQRLMSMPIDRSSLLLSRIAFQVLVGAGQAVVILVVAAAMGASLPGAAGIALILVVDAALATALTALFMALAYSSPGHNTFFSVSGFVALPLVFISDAFVPLHSMPDWLAAAAQANPITYGIDAIRLVMAGHGSSTLARDLAIVLAFAACSCLLAAMQFSRRISGVAR